MYPVTNAIKNQAIMPIIEPANVMLLVIIPLKSTLCTKLFTNGTIICSGKIATNNKHKIYSITAVVPRDKATTFGFSFSILLILHFFCFIIFDTSQILSITFFSFSSTCTAIPLSFGFPIFSICTVGFIEATKILLFFE